VGFQRYDKKEFLSNRTNSVVLRQLAMWERVLKQNPPHAFVRS